MKQLWGIIPAVLHAVMDRLVKDKQSRVKYRFKKTILCPLLCTPAHTERADCQTAGLLH